MSTITFDTLKFADTLKQAGVPDKQAEAEARAVAAAIGEVDVATRRDIDDLRRDLQAMELRLTVKLGTFMAMSIGLVAAVIKLL
ncbi:MAG: DUF1640 domain-containing protein [Sulfuritalea sp.]|nr:DUF1640 domain-containing protein [Sulfuritalea sp.]